MQQFFSSGEKQNSRRRLEQTRAASFSLSALVEILYKMQ